MYIVFITIKVYNMSDKSKEIQNHITFISDYVSSELVKSREKLGLEPEQTETLVQVVKSLILAGHIKSVSALLNSLEVIDDRF